MVRWLMFIVCLGLFVSRSLAEELTPLMQAHAHNDYHHKRPLLEALDHGFCSVEVDIFLVGGSLLVGHDRGELKPGKTLQSLTLTLCVSVFGKTVAAFTVAVPASLF